MRYICIICLVLFLNILLSTDLYIYFLHKKIYSYSFALYSFVCLLFTTGSLMHRSNIKELIKHGNLSTLEEVVLQGFGDRLLGETSTAPLVQDFLNKLPDYIVCIQLVL